VFLTRTRTVGWLVIALLMTVGFGIYGAVQANVYYNGEAVTAHVDSCETHRVYGRHGSHNQTSCQGSWQTADGKHHSGKIDGVSSPGDEGTDVQIRTSGDSAVLDSPWELWPLGVAAFGLLLVVGSGFTVRAAFRRPRSMSTVTRFPPPYRPYPPQPPHGGPPRPPYGGPPPGQPFPYQPPQQQRPPYPPPPPGYGPPSGGYPTPRR
jgi:hypothetical protein